MRDRNGSMLSKKLGYSDICIGGVKSQDLWTATNQRNIEPLVKTAYIWKRDVEAQTGRM